MYEEGKESHIDETGKKRANVLKKLIIALLITMMVVPAVLCIVLIVRMASIQKDVDEMLDIKNRQEIIVQQQTDESEDEKSSSDNEQHMGDESSSTEEQSTDGESSETTTDTTDEKESSTEENTIVEPLPDGKYAYLTFDDGPSANTMEILDILDQYGVKATFFVNGHTGSTMEERYKAIVDRGHAIGIHTYTHKYEEVYGGLDKFEQEIVSLRDYIYNVTGKDTNLFRFPGGSSNGVVDDVYPYIQWLNDNGYVYWDWNSSSGDASGSPVTAQQIVDNCMIQVDEGYKNVVILMHDTKSKVTTVEALPALIEALQAQGYEIRAIDERSTPVQHRKLQ